jgi:hypothetical protein
MITEKEAEHRGRIRWVLALALLAAGFGLDALNWPGLATTAWLGSGLLSVTGAYWYGYGRALRDMAERDIPPPNPRVIYHYADPGDPQ